MGRVFTCKVSGKKTKEKKSYYVSNATAFEASTLALQLFRDEFSIAEQIELICEVD